MNFSQKCLHVKKDKKYFYHFYVFSSKHVSKRPLMLLGRSISSLLLYYFYVCFCFHSFISLFFFYLFILAFSYFCSYFLNGTNWRVQQRAASLHRLQSQFYHLVWKTTHSKILFIKPDVCLKQQCERLKQVWL